MINSPANILRLGFCALLLSCYSASAAEPSRYEIDCRIDETSHRIAARQKVVFTNPTDKQLGEVYFHVYPHRKYTAAEKEFMLRFAGYFKVDPFPAGFQSGDLVIKKITDGKQELAFSYQGDDQTILKVNLARPLAKGEALTLQMDFQVDIPHSYGRFGWNEDIISLSRWYPLLSVIDEQGWHNYPFYPFHQPFFSQAAYYLVKIELPSRYTVVHTGNLKQETQSQGGKTLVIDSVLPVREFSFSASPDYRLYSKEVDGVKLNSYYLPGDEFYGQKALEFAAEVMEYYSRRFGKYPYQQFSIAPVFLGYGGNQLSNMIFIDTRAYKLPKFLIRYFDFLISHETGHQWFYNLVGNDEYKEMWLDEGFNSYFILQYLEYKYGNDAKVMVLPKGLEWLIPNFSFRRARDYRYLFLVKNGLDHSVLGELSSFQEPSSIFSITYGKGSQVLRMLRLLVGEEVFEGIFQRYFREYAYKNASVAGFIKIANEESGQDLTWFFDEWLLTSKFCDYAIKAVEKSAVVLENRGQIIMPVETQIVYSDAGTQTDKWDGKGKLRRIELKGSAAVKEVRVDPSEKLLDIERTNNFWPRQLYKKAVPLYYFAYEIPIMLPEDSYNLVAGPEISGGGLGLKASVQKPFDSIFYLSGDYDLSSNTSKSTLGYEMKHLFKSQTSLGFELFKNQDFDDKENDLEGGKIYLRRELWPASYGILQVNDHISLYMIHDREYAGTLTAGGLEDIQNLHYNKSRESIVGTTLTINRSGPYPDPKTGYVVNLTLENAGHFLGGDNYFWRGYLDWQGYKSVPGDGKLALRLKYGWGWPVDKSLYQLGGSDGLRGYRFKEIQGSRAVMANLEYRFPLIKKLDKRFLDNLFTLSRLDGVVFVDGGESWFRDFSDGDFKQDAGLGLRLRVDIGSFLESVIVRLDVAQAIDEPKQEPRVWLGINHAF